MAPETPSSAPVPSPRPDPSGPDRETLVAMYRTMLVSRAVDDREMSLKRQNRIFFQISTAGHEAIQVAMAAHLRAGSDWIHLYYRDRALALALGVTPLEQLLQAVGAEADPASGGRQMPSHPSSKTLRIFTTSSPTGTQYLQAVGTAEAGWRGRQSDAIRGCMEAFDDDEVALVCSGEGTTSEGEFWEALNTATTLQLPVIFLIEDNAYAISVPVEVQTPGGSISRLLSGFPNLQRFECDGTDLVESWLTCRDAVQACRDGRGPVLVHAHTVRPYSHSMSDDERAYRGAEELALQVERDPLRRGRTLLIERGILDAAALDALEKEVFREVAEASDRALEHPQPPPETAMKWLFSEEVDPTAEPFDTEDAPAYVDSKEYTMVDLLNRCMQDEMERDPGILIFGQDVADASREELLEEVSGKGGVFKVTHGLQRRFGGVRVFNSPLAEANILGRAIGMAARGLKPIVEIQFFDYIWPAFHQIRNELATIRYRSAGGWGAPMVIRAAYGGYLKGGSIYHSQTGETLFTHTPGLRVVLPATAEDAMGLLRTAIRCDDPVLFLEHKHLYRQVHNKGRYPGPEFSIPFGKAKVVRPGTHLSLITCGALVKRSMDAAKRAALEGIEVEVIDLRSLNPLDMDRIGTSVQKTGKALIVHEDPLSWGIGSEIAARIADELFPWLDGPVRRLASLDTWVAYAPQLEDVILPQTDDVLRSIRELAAY
jgi:2-oxoisovalerate dehydrogenase E1 component